MNEYLTKDKNFAITTIKLTSADPKFIDDIKAELSNAYKILNQSELFYNPKTQDRFCYIHILPAQRNHKPTEA